MARGRGRGRIGHSRGRRGRGRGRGGGGGNFLALRNGAQAGRAANAQASAEFNPEIHQKRQEAAGSRKRQADLGSWYKQLAQDYANSQQAGQQAFQSAEDTISKQLAEASERGKGEQNELAKSDTATASRLGGPQDTAGLAKIAQAGSAAERARVSINAPIAKEQANFVASLGGKRTAARMRGREAQTEESQRREKLRSDLTAALRQKGAARVVAKDKIRETERGYAAELKKLRLARQEARSSAQAAAADAALAQLKASREARQDAIGNRQAQERIGISRRNAKTSARSQRATAKHYKQGGKGGLTSGERNTNKKERQNAASLVHSAITQAGPPKTKAEAAELERLAVEAGGAPREVHRAVQNLLNRAKSKARGGYNRRVKRGEVAGPPVPGR